MQRHCSDFMLCRCLAFRRSSQEEGPKAFSDDGSYRPDGKGFPSFAFLQEWPNLLGSEHLSIVLSARIMKCLWLSERQAAVKAKSFLNLILCKSLLHSWQDVQFGPIHSEVVVVTPATETWPLSCQYQLVAIYTVFAEALSGLMTISKAWNHPTKDRPAKIFRDPTSLYQSCDPTAVAQPAQWRQNPTSLSLSSRVPARFHQRYSNTQ